MTAPPQRAREVFDELAAGHRNRPGVARRSMFGRDTLTVDGAMYAFLHHDRLAVKLPAGAAAALLSSGAAVTPEMGGKPMRRWVAVPLAASPDGDERWGQLLDAAHAYMGGGPDAAAPAVAAVPPAERFAALVAEFAGCPDVAGPRTSGRRGFGSSALTVHGSIFAMLVHDQLVVKLPADRVETLISEGTGGPFDAGKGRPMRQWVTVTADARDTWRALAREALEFVGSRRG